MRHLKHILMVFIVFLLVGCSENLNPNNQSSTSDIIYASEIDFQLSELNVKVGDKIKLTDLKVDIMPTTANVVPIIEVEQTNSVIVQNNEITFLGVGEIQIVAKVLSGLNTFETAILNCNIFEKDVFATSVEFEAGYICLDITETFENKLQILPANYNKEIIVSYPDSNIVATYDYTTGLITPIKEGCGKINVTTKTAENEDLTVSFDVLITNNIYAQSITNCKFDNISIGNEVDLFIGDKGKFSFDVLPSNFNMDLFVEVSNELISLTESGDFTVGNKTGNCKLKIYAQTKTDYITKTINVNIVKPAETIDFVIKYNNEIVSEIYANVQYDLEITTSLHNYDSITFDNCEYEYLHDNLYKIKFCTSGNINLIANTTILGTISNKPINSTKAIIVYNIVEDVNFSLWHNNVEILPINNVYTLYLPNINHLDLAIEQNELVYADISLSAKGINTKQNILNYAIQGENIIVTENRIIANKLGTDKIVVTSNDIGGFSKEYIIEVRPLEVREIIVNNPDIRLYLNGDEKYTCSEKIDFYVLPECAYNTNVEISTTSSIISINKFTITALNGGTASVMLNNVNISTTINVVVDYVPSHLCVKLNNIEIENNDVYICEVNDILTLSVDVYSNNVLLNNKDVVVKINSELVKSEFMQKIIFDECGTYNITITFSDLSFEFTVISKLTNKITKFEFLQDKLEINSFFTTNLALDYNIEYQYPNCQVTDLLTFVSSNTQVATLNGNLITILNPGKTTIVAYINGDEIDEFELCVYYKQIIEINSLNDFYNIQDDKAYIVNNNLDFENFSVNNSKNFNGEIDFNNKVITNLKYPLFNTLGENAKVINLYVSGTIEIDSDNFDGDIDENFSFVAIQNCGTIDNLCFKDLQLTISNSQEKESLTTSLIACDNNGIISNVNYNNTSILVTDISATSVNSYVVCAGVVNNYGTICNIAGAIVLTGFTKVGGLSINHFNLIKDVNLKLKYNCTQNKIQIGGLIYKSFKNDDFKPTLKDVVLNIELTNISDCTDVKFGGLVFANQISDVINIKLNYTFTGDFNSNQVYLLFYTKGTNNLENVNVESNKEFGE